MSSHFKELEDHIEAIITTAKLLGYTTKKYPNTRLIYEPPSTRHPFMEISLIDHREGQSFLLTRYKYEQKHSFINSSHEEKIKHLQELIKKL